MKKYLATIVRIDNSFQKSYMLSEYNESKERFVERVKNCYIKPYKDSYYEVKIYEVNEPIFESDI